MPFTLRSSCASRLVLATIAVLLVSPTASALRGQARPDTAAIDRIARAQADSGFNGVVLVAVGDSVVLHRTYGPRRFRLRTGFWIGSMTKGFTAAAILALQQDGRLSVRDSIAR